MAMKVELSSQFAQEVSGEQINILAVDDRPEGLMALEAVLNSPEYRIVKAQSGEDALRAILREDFALILLDVQMPGMNGFETAKLIRERWRTRETPIIFITAISTDDKYVYQGYQAGAVDYLFKPINPEILSSKVKVFAELHKKNLQIQRQAEQLQEAERRERERQIAELERESNRRYQNLADTIPNIVWKAHSPDEMYYFNRRWYEYTDLTSRESLQSGWKAAVHPEDLDEMRESWRRSGKTDGPFEAECRLRRGKIGPYRWHLIQAFRETDIFGRPTGWLGTCIEIHERKEAEQERASLLVREKQARKEAQQLARRFVQLTEMLPQMVFDFRDPDSVWWNRSWKEYTGSSDELPVDRSFDLIHPDEKERVRSLWEECRKELKPFSAQFRIRSKDGNYRWFLANSLPCANDEGHADRWVGICTDIQEFYDQNELRARFLSIASHELKTPLTSMKMTLQLQLKSLMEGTHLNPDLLKKLLDIGVRSSDRLANLIDDLLDFSRMESGQLDVTPAHCDLAQVVREALGSSLTSIESTGRLKLETEIPATLEGQFDAVRMRQVIDNLIGNAIKYTPEQGTISVRLSSEQHQAILEIRDTGIGIAPEDQRRIFRAFERAVTQQEFSGLGIGLYVSTRIIDQHSGSLNVASEKGNGSTFTVRLPIRGHNHDFEEGAKA